MGDPFYRAETCRARAAELRGAAARASEPETKAALLDLAESLEHHARTLAAMGIKFGITRGAVPVQVAEAAD